MMAMRLVRPAWLIDINEIPALKFVKIEKDAVRVGRMHAAMHGRARSGSRRARCRPRSSPRLGGSRADAKRGTIGGSLAHADPCAELPLAAQVLGARMLLRSAKGVRTLEAEKFFAGPMRLPARSDECLEEINWPSCPGDARVPPSLKFPCAHGDFAMVAAAAQIAIDGDGRCVRAAFGLGGAGGTPLAFPKIAARLGRHSARRRGRERRSPRRGSETEPGSDLHASAEYRRHLAGVLAGRALREARERARNQ